MTVLPYPTEPLPGLEHLAPEPPSLEEQRAALDAWLRAALAGAGAWRDVADVALRDVLTELEELLADGTDPKGRGR